MRLNVEDDTPPPGNRGCAAASGGLKVLLLAEAAATGTGRHVLDLAEGLDWRGCQVHLLYSSSRADEAFLIRLKALPALRQVSCPCAATFIHRICWPRLQCADI